MNAGYRKDQRMKVAISLIVLLCVGFLLFFNLGHYGFWDDEASCVLYAKSLWRTGDTKALLDHNLIAYNSGRELKNLRMRYPPPLQFYVCAPFVGLFEGSIFAARLPFALCGLITMLVMLLWLWRKGASLGMWLLLSFGMLCNVSFMLHVRQCRYYSLIILFTLILAYLYFNNKKERWKLISFSFVSLLLLASNHMSYVAASVCLIVDYLIWGRKERVFKKSELAMIFLPQILLGCILVSIYNPLRMNLWGVVHNPFLKHRLQLALWNLRELNACEFGWVCLFYCAPFFIFLKRMSGC